MKLFYVGFALLFCHATVAQKKPAAISTFSINSKTDIDAIVKEIGNKRIVAIGEDTHGTKEYYEIRSAVTKKLMAEKGFNVFTLENPFEDMIALQNDLFSVALDTLMQRHLFSIYQTQEMKSFLAWLKNFSKNHSIKITGCDDSYREILPALLKKEIKKYNSITLNDLALEFEQRQLAADVESYYSLPGKVKPDSLPDDNQFGYDTYKLLVKLDSLYKATKVKNIGLGLGILSAYGY